MGCCLGFRSGPHHVLERPWLNERESECVCVRESARERERERENEGVEDSQRERARERSETETLLRVYSRHRSYTVLEPEAEIYKSL